MKESTISTLQIEDGLYGFELKQVLWKQQFDQHEHKDSLLLILKMLNVDLQHCEAKDLIARFGELEIAELKDLSLNHYIENKEVQARWLDLQITVDKKNIKAYVIPAREAYMAIYVITSQIDYLVRATALVKYAKGIFKSKLDEIFLEVKLALMHLDSAYYQQLVLTELLSIFGVKKCKEELAGFFEEQITGFTTAYDFRSARFCIKSLNLINALDGNQCNIRMAENYELQGDHTVSQMEPHTLYPNIAAPYLKGFRLIASASSCEGLRNRLEHKVDHFLVEDFKSVQLGGVRLIPQVDLDTIYLKVFELNIKDAGTAYSNLLNLPILPTSSIKEFACKSQEAASERDVYFSAYVKITEKGAKVASQDASAAHLSNARTYLREKLMAYIYFIKAKLDAYIDFNEAMVGRMLTDANSPFVPEDRIYSFAIGLLAGFKNDFVTAAHLLLPQLENSLRYLAVQNGIIATTYDKDLQFENLLGGVLSKVRPLADPDIIDELSSFLVDNNNINFRNELLHGIMAPALVQKYGLYAWWLCLKIIMQTKVIFPKAKI